MSLPWKRVSDYCIRCGDYRVSKVVVMGKATYEAWQGKNLLGRRDTPAEAKALCEPQQKEIAA